MAFDTAEIARVTSLVGDLARRDVSGLANDDLVAGLEAVARLGRHADTLRARFAGEIAQRSRPTMTGGGLARVAGFGDAGKMVSKVTGGSVAGAKRSIEAGEALAPEVPRDPRTGGVMVDAADASSPNGPDASTPVTPAPPRFPVLAEAALAGDLSVEVVGVITAGLNMVTDRIPSDTLRELERRLVDKAKSLTVHEVRRMVARAVAQVDVPGLEARERRNFDDRFLTWSEDHTGMVTFTGRLDVVTAAPIRTTIEQMVTAQYRARRDQDPTEQDQRSVGQMRADALAQLCRHALGCKETKTSGIRATIVVRAHLKDLIAGMGLGSIDGINQPVSVSELRRLAGDAGIIPEVLGGDGVVLDLGRTTRFFTEPQRLALIERDGGCAKCHAPPEHCEAHHIVWWAHGGRTDLSNGVMLCTRCHHDVHRQGWEIIVHGNRVDFIPPATIDPDRRPQPGGIAALDIDVGSIGPPADDHHVPAPGDDHGADDYFADAFDLGDDDHFVDNNMIREWENAARAISVR
jgi:hypothetical protein